MIRPVVVNESLKRIEFYSPLLTDYEWITITIEAVLMVMVLLSNSLVAFVIIKSPLLRHCPSNICILSLNISDLFGGISDAIILMTLIFDESLGAILTCRIRYLMAITWILSSLHSLLGITVDRIIAVCHPLRYSAIVTNQRLIFLLTLFWMDALFVGCFTLFFTQNDCYICDPILCLPHEYLIYFCVHCLAIIIVIICCYLKIFTIARLQERRHNIYTIDGRFGSTTFWHRKRYVRTLVMVFSVILLFIVPIILIISIELINGNDISLQNARIIASLICQSTAILNPIVYIWRNRRFVYSFNRIFFKSE